MKNRDGLETNDDWETPDWLYHQLDGEFHFDFDPCPLHADFDGLSVDWGNSNYVNPPYNRIVKPKFIYKAYEQWRQSKTIVLLLPAATGTQQFHQYILPFCEIRFFEGRIAFKGFNTKGVYTEWNKGKSDSMLVIYRAGYDVGFLGPSIKVPRVKRGGRKRGIRPDIKAARLARLSVLFPDAGLVRVPAGTEPLHQP